MKTKKPNWSAEELATLAQLFPAAPEAEILAALPGRYWSAIVSKASNTKVLRNTIWPDESIKFLVDNYKSMGAVGVGDFLGKPPHTVQRKAAALGVRRAYATNPAERKLEVARERAARTRLLKPGTKLKATGRPAATPIINAIKAERRKAERAAKLAAKEDAKNNKSITADAIRKMPYNHPERLAYMANGVAGWRAYQKTQNHV